MQLFGFEIRKKDNQPGVGSVVPPSSDDGSTVVASASAYYGMVMDIEGVVKNENDLIRRYREIAQYADTDMAIEDIINEAIVSDDGAIKMNLDAVKLSEPIKKKFHAEFDTILRLLKFRERGHDIFRQWYIDGRVYYHILIDEDNIKQGIVELRQVDPRKIRRIKNVEKAKTPQGVDVTKIIDEFYLYNDKGITEQTTQGVKMTLDSIIFTPSGLIDANTGMMLSHLHKAIKPVNQLKMIEDAVVIYRISRAPERRVFYIDVGNLPKLKAEQYVNDIMNKFRNKVVYDATTGEVRDDRKHLSMMEDFWMPRREGGKGTEITTLPGGQNLGDIQDIQYFQQKLYQALNVPLSRLQQQQGFSLGRSTEITRDEIKFSKFINRLRSSFQELLVKPLYIQVCLKFPELQNDLNLKSMISIQYNKDNMFDELKTMEIMQKRLDFISALKDNLVETDENMNDIPYFDLDFLVKKYLKMDPTDLDQNAKEKKQKEERKKAAGGGDDLGLGI